MSDTAWRPQARRRHTEKIVADLADPALDALLQAGGVIGAGSAKVIAAWSCPSG